MVQDVVDLESLFMPQPFVPMVGYYYDCCYYQYNVIICFDMAYFYGVCLLLFITLIRL